MLGTEGPREVPGRYELERLEGTWVGDFYAHKHRLDCSTPRRPTDASHRAVASLLWDLCVSVGRNVT